MPSQYLFGQNVAQEDELFDASGKELSFWLWPRSIQSNIIKHLLFGVLCCALPLLVFLTAGAEWRDPHNRTRTEPLAIGYIDHDSVYYLHFPDLGALAGELAQEDINAFYHRLQLWKVSISKDFSGKMKQYSIVDTTYRDTIVETSRAGFYRWRIHKNCYWGSGIDPYFLRIPLSELKKQKRLPSIEELKNIELKQTIGDGSFWFLEPVKLIIERESTGWGLLRGSAASDACVDFLPIKENEILTFFSWRGEIQVRQGTLQFSKPPEKHRIKWKNQKDAKPWPWTDAEPIVRIASPLRERFIVYGDSVNFFFVTVSGKLYVAPNKSGGKSRTTTAWDDAKRPIVSIVTDTVTNKTFAFTQTVKPDRKSSEDVYFELSEKLKPLPYDRKRLNDVKAPERLNTVLQYARFLMEEKKLGK